MRSESSRKRAQAALTASQERFRELADNLSQFVWTVDATGWRTWFNKRWYDHDVRRDARLRIRSAIKREVVEVLGERQLGDGELIFDRARLLLVDLGGEQIDDDTLGLMAL
jgi:PAS domain-containing protein